MRAIARSTLGQKRPVLRCCCPRPSPVCRVRKCGSRDDGVPCGGCACACGGGARGCDGDDADARSDPSSSSSRSSRSGWSSRGTRTCARCCRDARGSCRPSAATAPAPGPAVRDSSALASGSDSGVPWSRDARPGHRTWHSLYEPSDATWASTSSFSSSGLGLIRLI